MYKEFYNLKGFPFKMIFDNKLFFVSKTHRRALSSLEIGLEDDAGFIVLTGAAGSGKTATCDYFLSTLDKTKFIGIRVTTPKLEPEDLFRTICSSFFIRTEGENVHQIIIRFENFLREQQRKGRTVLLVIDEAHNLPVSSLEKLRIVSEISSEEVPLVKIFFIAQENFLSSLSKPELRIFLSKVNVSYELERLTKEETFSYIEHRLSFSGYNGSLTHLFSSNALKRIFFLSRGLPEEINNICDKALTYGAANQLYTVCEKDILNMVESFASKDDDIRSLERDMHQTPEPNINPDKNRIFNRNISLKPDNIDMNILSEEKPTPDSALHREIPHYLDEQFMHIKRRVDNIEKIVLEHERALRELINVAVMQLRENQETKDTGTDDIENRKQQ